MVVWRLTRGGGTSDDRFWLCGGYLSRGLNVSKAVAASAAGAKRQAAIAEPSFILAGHLQIKRRAAGYQCLYSFHCSCLQRLGAAWTSQMAGFRE